MPPQANVDIPIEERDGAAPGPSNQDESGPGNPVTARTWLPMPEPTPTPRLHQLEHADSLAGRARLYEDHDWSKDTSILSQVCIPEDFIYDCLSEIIPRAQKDFLKMSKRYWPRLYKEHFLGLWQLVNFGNEEQHHWRTESHCGFRDPGNFYEDNQVTFDELRVGLDLMMGVRNMAAHPRKLLHEGSVRTYDGLFRSAQYFFIVVGSEENANIMYKLRMVLKNRAKKALAYMEDLYILVPRYETYQKGKFTLLVPMGKDHPEYGHTLRQLYEEERNALTHHDRQTLDLMIKWVQEKEATKPYKSKTAEDIKADHQLSQNLRDILEDTIAAREELQRFKDEQNRKKVETRNEEEKRKQKELDDNYPEWVNQKEAEMEAETARRKAQEKEEQENPPYFPPEKECLDPPPQTQSSIAGWDSPSDKEEDASLDEKDEEDKMSLDDSPNPAQHGVFSSDEESNPAQPDSFIGHTQLFAWCSGSRDLLRMTEGSRTIRKRGVNGEDGIKLTRVVKKVKVVNGVKPVVNVRWPKAVNGKKSKAVNGIVTVEVLPRRTILSRKAKGY